MSHVDPRENVQKLREFGVETVQELMSNCTYLEDSGVELYGIKIYGSPWFVSLSLFSCFNIEDAGSDCRKVLPPALSQTGQHIPAV